MGIPVFLRRAAVGVISTGTTLLIAACYGAYRSVPPRRRPHQKGGKSVHTVQVSKGATTEQRFAARDARGTHQEPAQHAGRLAVSGEQGPKVSRKGVHSPK